MAFLRATDFSAQMIVCAIARLEAACLGREASSEILPRSYSVAEFGEVNTGPLAVTRRRLSAGILFRNSTSSATVGRTCMFVELDYSSPANGADQWSVVLRSAQIAAKGT
jgi:hypothetical protein